MMSLTFRTVVLFTVLVGAEFVSARSIYGYCKSMCKCEGTGNKDTSIWSSVTCGMARSMTSVPEGHPNITRLYFSGTGISHVSAGDFASYPNLTELFFRDNAHFSCQLEHIEPGSFDNLTRLKKLGLVGCSRLTEISAGVLGTFESLDTLDIFRNGLTTAPNLTRFENKNKDTEGSLTEIDLHNNMIERIDSHSFYTVKTETLNLEGNRIRSIESNAFSKATVLKLRLKENRELKALSSDAFKGLIDLQELDMSDTSIVSLPTVGIEKLKTLLLKNTPSLKHFPTVLEFKKLTRAELTYPHHCCAFKNPDKQKTSTLRTRTKKKMSESCDTRSTAMATLQDIEFGKAVPINVTPETIIKSCKNGNYHHPKRNVSCIPEPDAFNPCEDVMGYSWLRVTVWFVLLASLLGNSIVLVVLIKSHGKFTVPKFLMCNLAFADLLMGVYLILLASIDIRTLGEYFNYAIEWQNEGGCQAAGFLSVFSSEFSIFSLMIITLERWYAISHAIHLNKRLKMRHSIVLMYLAFGFATTLAVLPLVGVSGYGHVSICLPMKLENSVDVGYVVFILVLNGVMFLAICLCYLNMYWKVKRSATNARNNDTRIAKRMALLVLTNFACWAPIAFFGLTASAGKPLIDITNSKILLVFFYPLNSCANPFLYAILTKQFRKDVFIILGKNGLCVEKASKYRVTYTSRSLSQSRGNKDITIHGLHNRSESLFTHLPDTNHGRKYSVNSPPKVHPRLQRPETTVFHSDRTTEVTYRNHGNSAKVSSVENCCAAEVKRPPYVRSVSDYITFDPKRHHSTKNFSKEQKSTDTYFSNSTDTTGMSDYSHGTSDDIWKIRELDAETEVSLDVDCFYHEESNHSKCLQNSCQPSSQEMETFDEPECEEDKDEKDVYSPLLEKTPEDTITKQSEMCESSFQ